MTDIRCDGSHSGCSVCDVIRSEQVAELRDRIATLGRELYVQGLAHGRWKRSNKREMDRSFRKLTAQLEGQGKAIAGLRAQVAEERSRADAALRRGFEIAQGEAEIREHDGWQRTAPFIEWEGAQKELDRALAEAGETGT